MDPGTENLLILAVIFAVVIAFAYLLRWRDEATRRIAALQDAVEHYHQAAWQNYQAAIQAQSEVERLRKEQRHFPRVHVVRDEWREVIEYLRTITDQPTGHVYFIGNREQRIVKIGYSADPSRRLPSIQTGSAYPLELFGTIEGSEATELKLHARFAHLHRTGEWFDLGEDLVRFIAIATDDQPTGDTEDEAPDEDEVQVVEVEPVPDWRIGDHVMVEIEDDPAVYISEEHQLQRAIDFTKEQGEISVTMLQRKFRIGYKQARELIDTMEAEGVIGPYEGGNTRRKVIT